MKFANNSIGIKLLRYFIILIVGILLLLWLLQTVFLQGFYNHLQLQNVTKTADTIAQNIGKENLTSLLGELAYENSMRIVLTDWDSTILYSADAYNTTYQAQKTNDTEQNTNPYAEGSLQNWQLATYRYLPDDYEVFLQKLQENKAAGTVIYQETPTENQLNLVYGRVLFPGEEQETVLYIKTPVGVVGAAAGILRIILLVVTIVALLIGLFLAYIFSKKFSLPVSALSAQAEKMADGEEVVSFPKGFCAELDALAQTLEDTSHKLSQAEQMRKDLLANISHDLRTPLTLIKGYAEKINDISCENPAEARGDATLICREANRLTDLVNDIVNYSILQAGATSFDVEPIDISALIKSAAAQFAVLESREGIRIEQELQPNLYVMADRKSLMQVLYNLIANATVHVGMDKMVLIHAYKNAQAVRVEVIDHGEGILESELSHVWERYFTSRERKRSRTGTGLGLSIVKEIVEAHKGKYGVDSAIGKGTTFWFEFKLDILEKS